MKNVRQLTDQQYWQGIEEADLLYSMDEVRSAVERVAKKITEDMQGKQLTILVLMNGGLVFAGSVIPHIGLPTLVDYVHATRYRNKLVGEQLQWLVKPHSQLQDKDVLVLDDIYDAGITLSEVVEYCHLQNVRSVTSCVLAYKELPSRPSLDARYEPDYYALRVPNRYVFGMGMDCEGYYRNAPGIYALKD